MGLPQQCVGSGESNLKAPMPQLVKTGSNSMRIPWLFSLVYVRGRDRARLLRLAGAPGVRFRIDWRTNAEHRIVRRRHTHRQRQPVEIDICGGAWLPPPAALLAPTP